MYIYKIGSRAAGFVGWVGIHSKMENEDSHPFFFCCVYTIFLFFSLSLCQIVGGGFDVTKPGGRNEVEIRRGSAPSALRCCTVEKNRPSSLFLPQKKKKVRVRIQFFLSKNQKKLSRRRRRKEKHETGICCVYDCAIHGVTLPSATVDGAWPPHWRKSEVGHNLFFILSVTLPTTSWSSRRSFGQSGHCGTALPFSFLRHVLENVPNGNHGWHLMKVNITRSPGD